VKKLSDADDLQRLMSDAWPDSLLAEFLCSGLKGVAAVMQLHVHQA
jgi:hypothetical protein